MATRRALSIEDGDLGRSTIITARDRQYSDIDLTMEPRPSGDVYKKTDAAAVKQAIKTLLLTGKFEKPFQPRFGGDLGSQLFEMLDDDSEDVIRDSIEEMIRVYEPRADIRGIQVTPNQDNNQIHVEVVFAVVNTQDVVTFSTVLSRLR